MAYEMTNQDFDRVLRDYRPSKYETFGDDDPRFSTPMNHALKCRDRLYVALRSGLQRLPEGQQTIVDFGPFPGSLLRLLRLIEPTRAARLFGAGLMASPEFVQFMRQDADVEILTVNLDPAGQQFTSKGYQEKVPLPDHSAQLVFALEIVEHLTSPFHLMTEAHRILKSGGHFVITTPNVTRIGNIFKLLIGRSPNDRLAPPGYNDPNDEWRPHAREYAMHELGEMLCHVGFEIAEERFFLGEDTQSCRQPVSQHAIDWAKLPFYVVPHLRGSLLLVVRKP
jgi:SAM-dependent methyltransferase